MRQRGSLIAELARDALKALGGVPAVKASSDAADVIDSVFVTIEGDPALRRNYDDLVEMKGHQVANSQISQATARIMRGRTFGERVLNPRSDLIRGYSRLRYD